MRLGDTQAQAVAIGAFRHVPVSAPPLHLDFGAGLLNASRDRGSWLELCVSAADESLAALALAGITSDSELEGAAFAHVALLFFAFLVLTMEAEVLATSTFKGLIANVAFEADLAVISIWVTHVFHLLLAQAALDVERLPDVGLNLVDLLRNEESEMAAFLSLRDDLTTVELR